MNFFYFFQSVVLNSYTSEKDKATFKAVTIFSQDL